MPAIHVPNSSSILICFLCCYSVAVEILYIYCKVVNVCIDSGSTNRAYRMPHTSMINITFGEERREEALRQQKQSTSTSITTPQHQKLVFHNRTPRLVANGNGKQQQQQQQQPVYKVLQNPHRVEASSPGQQVAARQQPQLIRPPQPATVSPKFCIFYFF